MLGIRGRLTVPDILFVLFAMVALGALWPVVYESLQLNADQLSTGEAYLYQLLLPGALLVLLGGIWQKAIRGA
jgi:cytochrome c biogenesis factor